MSYWCLYYICFQCLFGRRGTAKKFQNRRRLSSMRSAGMAKSFKKVYFDMKLVRKAIYFVGPILSVVCRARYQSGQFHRVFTLLSFLLAGSRDENLRYVNCRLILGGLGFIRWVVIFLFFCPFHDQVHELGVQELRILQRHSELLKKIYRNPVGGV